MHFYFIQYAQYGSEIARDTKCQTNSQCAEEREKLIRSISIMVNKQLNFVDRNGCDETVAVIAMSFTKIPADLLFSNKALVKAQ